MAERVPLQRYASADEVAKLVLCALTRRLKPRGAVVPGGRPRWSAAPLDDLRTRPRIFEHPRRYRSPVVRSVLQSSAGVVVVSGPVARRAGRSGCRRWRDHATSRSTPPTRWLGSRPRASGGLCRGRRHRRSRVGRRHRRLDAAVGPVPVPRERGGWRTRRRLAPHPPSTTWTPSTGWWPATCATRWSRAVRSRTASSSSGCPDRSSTCRGGRPRHGTSRRVRRIEGCARIVRSHHGARMGAGVQIVNAVAPGTIKTPRAGSAPVTRPVKANVPAGIKMDRSISGRSNALWQILITQIILSLNTDLLKTSLTLM